MKTLTFRRRISVGKTGTVISLVGTDENDDLYLVVDLYGHIDRSNMSNILSTIAPAFFKPRKPGDTEQIVATMLLFESIPDREGYLGCQVISLLDTPFSSIKVDKVQGMSADLTIQGPGTMGIMYRPDDIPTVVKGLRMLGEALADGSAFEFESVPLSLDLRPESHGFDFTIGIGSHEWINCRTADRQDPLVGATIAEAKGKPELISRLADDLATALDSQTEYPTGKIILGSDGQWFIVGQARIVSIDDEDNEIPTPEGFEGTVPRMGAFVGHSVFTTYTDAELNELRRQGKGYQIKGTEPPALLFFIDLDRIEAARNALRSLSYCIRTGRDKQFERESDPLDEKPDSE